ncbi:MAG: acetyl/propionyl/methylcrotonyl-CoA carboxylase subunit alpha [Halieaceae bacterium]|uniref:acetyl/propionyl/methylcrotonyl-CoA carboxylase subunit alpha n=1 Tax=Haliea alexandrii TaxID=2448162 RepID=UPI000F0B2D71|nr:acetyl/propionyl/methylcrotonyl-CoA carboxylase subunit alpha [Haliea alexandrii]MCR9186749.1 acetyl/propionyl/methylcrotonyl-CoA carboxylase subunit alpha [Halieaceae bacterium]
MFNKLLIANRGEIACRIMHTARRMGIATVAVYSDADRNALHVRMADEAVHIGPAPARESYLVAERLIAAALGTGAQAIHPGYGFLSENAAFASACAEQGLVFVGPPTGAIEAMGSKSAAKHIMGEAGVPLVPGYHDADQDPALLRREAERMGYPVLLKATAGGGGKGMRQVWSGEEFDAALAAAQREASASFGDATMLVEKYLTKPRHVEVQVFCDNHGNAIYLAERDCSVQRRHQKVIEEAPAPGMTPALRAAMGDTAVQAARAIDYRGAGTVEFLLDEDGSFYFMEMNTRLQVEHPVTEMITGQDLVEWQLRVAAGEVLPLQQEELSLRGHAFEARVYAEDPDNDFLPVTGTLAYLQAPEESAHVRVDTGVQQGDEISVHYDPMIAKLIVWDESRERALQRLAAALRDYRIGGTVTNLDFLYNLATAAPFQQAELDTGFIERHQSLIFRQRQLDLQRDLPMAAFALFLQRQREAAPRSCLDPWSPWASGTAWRLNEPHVHHLLLHCHQRDVHATLEQLPGGGFCIDIDGERSQLRGALQGDALVFEQDGHRRRATLARTADGFTLYLADGACHFRELPPDTGEASEHTAAGGLNAPMNGTVVSLLIEAGTEVAAGTPLMIMEAMKMEHTVRAPGAGTVSQFYFAAGDLVDGGAPLLAFTPSEEVDA